MHDTLQKVRPVVSRTFGADEDLVLMGEVRRRGGGFGPRAMTSLRAHVILLRRSPISRDSQLSRMGREGRSNPGDSGSHSPTRERGERERGACIQDWTVPEMGQIKTTRTKRRRLTLGGERTFLKTMKPFPHLIH